MSHVALRSSVQFSAPRGVLEIGTAVSSRIDMARHIGDARWGATVALAVSAEERRARSRCPECAL